MTTVYVSGPMTGYDDFNYPAFHAAANELLELGFDVVNPAENFEGRTGLPLSMYLRKDIGQLIDQCDAVYMLHGWENSAGARMEWAVANGLDLDLMFQDGQPSMPVEYEASRIVRNGERQKSYGHPNQDFERTAGMWTAFLRHKLLPGVSITMEEMALMMGQLKMSRLASTPGHHDSLVDLIGYAICASRLKELEWKK